MDNSERDPASFGGRTPGGMSAARIETATIVVTDLVGSTELASRVGAVKFEELRREHDSILSDDVEDAGGRVFKNAGDGLLASFPSVTAALAAAVAIQQHMDRRSRRTEIPMSVRIGISIGDAWVEDGDYFGVAPTEAVRLCARAAGGQILAADLVRAILRDSRSFRFEPGGALELKGLPEPVVAWEVTWEPLPQVHGARLPARLCSTPHSPFVGRASEQRRLIECWKLAVDGQRQVVVISGEPGIGKTRLVSETMRTAIPDGALVFYGRCDEDQGMPYHPWLDILRDFVRVAPRRMLRPFAGELSRLVPELHEKLGTVTPPTPSNREVDRYLTFAAVSAVLSAAATELGPVVVILDDLHWADESTLQLFKSLSATCSGRLLLLATYRDSDIAPDDHLSAALADLRRETDITRMTLAGLNETEIVALVETSAGHKIDTAGLALAGQIHRETAGNPFFVVELLRHLRETAAINLNADGRWSFADPPPLREVPQSVREVILRRVNRLSGDARKVLSAASVIGSEFDLDRLTRSLSMPGAKVLDLLDGAVAASLLTERLASHGAPGHPGPGRLYDFTHGLVQATLYDALPSARRDELHRAVARAGEEIAGHARRLELGSDERVTHYTHRTAKPSTVEASDCESRSRRPIAGYSRR